MVASQVQRVCRTGKLIARGREEHAMINIQITGRGPVIQDGRTAVLAPGAMTFLDWARPYRLRFNDLFSQLLVNVSVRSC
jgi:hypothetical protein